MNKGYLITIAMVAISVVGIVSIYASYEYSNQLVDVEEIPEIPKIVDNTEVELTRNHEMSEMLVNLMIENYEKGNKEISSLDKKLGFKITGVGMRYGFVLDENEMIVAHYNPKFIGQKNIAMSISIESKDQILSTLNNEGQIWIHYDFINPETKKIEPKTSFLKMYDGLIFGSGFYN